MSADKKRACRECGEAGGRGGCGFSAELGGSARLACKRCRADAEALRKAGLRAERARERAEAAPDHERFAGLVKLCRRRPVAFSELCDKLDLSPARARRLIEEALAAGAPVRVDQDHVLAEVRQVAPEDRVVEAEVELVKPVVGERQLVAFVTDTHLGSKYCLRAQLREFVEHAYARGVREVLHGGDVLDGDYRHGKFEMSHMGVEEQTRDLFEVLPQKPGLTYHGITGNHDFTFTEESGVNVGRYVSDYFRRRGREDVHFYGDRGAFLKLRGTTFHLWHPSGGVSYAVSYKMQKKIEGYSSGEKPGVLLIGHWHRYCHIVERGVHAVAGGTFQGGGSAFSKSLTCGAPAIGGQVLSWEATEDRTLRSFTVERRSYFEHERPHRVEPAADVEV